MSFEIDDEGDLLWRNEKGQWHREKGPAFIITSGHISYRINNKLHRLDGPAIIWSDGLKSYYIHDQKYSKEAYYAKVKEL